MYILIIDVHFLTVFADEHGNEYNFAKIVYDILLWCII